jgi:hypothetical protein
MLWHQKKFSKQSLTLEENLICYKSQWSVIQSNKKNSIWNLNSETEKLKNNLF